MSGFGCLSLLELHNVPIHRRQNTIDNYIDSFCSAVHTAARSVTQCRPHHPDPKPYWCNELNKLRDRKKFWWKLWLDNGKPKQGQIFVCHKYIKKVFRKSCRKYASSCNSNNLQKLTTYLKSKNSTAFWKQFNMRNKVSTEQVHTPSNAEFVRFYSQVMGRDDCGLTNNQLNVIERVNGWMAEADTQDCNYHFPDHVISKAILDLNLGKSPGIDGILSEHLYHGMSEELLTHISRLFHHMVTFCTVPKVFSVGILVPILKKPTLDPLVPASYRPLTMCSTMAKLFEAITVPSPDLCNTQFGFRSGMGTDLACGVISNSIAIAKEKATPLFVASLDAEKCFDRIWHAGLFFKLYNHLPLPLWRFAKTWYDNLSICIKTERRSARSAGG